MMPGRHFGGHEGPNAAQSRLAPCFPLHALIEWIRRSSCTLVTPNGVFYASQDMNNKLPWHQLTAGQALDGLHSQRSGLDDDEAVSRQSSYGRNELESGKRISAWRVFAEQFKNVLTILLLVAVALSTLLGHTLEAVVIALIVVFAILLGFIQEYRAERAMEALRQMAAPMASVVRGGQEQSIPASRVVPGDILLLRTGDRVPADVRLVDAVNLQINEAPLTGESFPVDKQVEALKDADLPTAERSNMAYSGTDVTLGRGTGVVTAIGMDTEFGQITRLLQSVEQDQTPLQRNLDRVGRMLVVAAVVVVVIIAALGIWRGAPLLEMLIFGIALAVAVVPEALPAVVTISLAIGMQRMAKCNALVNRLPTVETLGCTSVICSDKTGTLTRNEMTARQVWQIGSTADLTGQGYEPHGEFDVDGSRVQPSPELMLLLETAALASDAQLEKTDHWEIHGDPTEGALVVAAAKAGIDKSGLEEKYPRIAEIPFTSESKRMTTLHRDGDDSVACSKGAPEAILSTCSRILTPQGEEELTGVRHYEIEEAASRMAQNALRVIGISRKTDCTLESCEHGQVFLGLVGIIDPPRQEAAEAIQICRKAGIRPVMITGDHPVTASAIARELGISETSKVMTGADLDHLGDTELASRIPDVGVYARVSPEHKLRIVDAWKSKGRIVAMTGDGVNDAPALKMADIGVAMGITGTDVSKQAADMTLTDDNFASIVAAVREGRAIYTNIKKYLMYLLSTNIGEIGLFAVAALAGLPLPLTAVQILYVNLVTDGLPALALAVDPEEADLMEQPPRDPDKGIFTRSVVTLMLVGGIWSTLVNVSLFSWALQSGRDLERAMTMTFVSLVLIQFFNAYNFRSERTSVLHDPFANRWLNHAVGWELLLLPLVVYLPFLQQGFGTYPLVAVDWLIIIGAAWTVMPVLELAKFWIRRSGSKR